MAKQITLGVEENGISFTFDESTHYLYGDGKIVCPKNSLILVTDESEMFTLKKANGDVFLSARYDAVEGISSKEDLVDWFIENAVGNVGGGIDPETLAELVSSAEYVSSSSTIDFKNVDGEVISTINAEPFITDGMVDNVQISGTNLVITFNVDAGKQPISIPLTDIFNPSNYYDKTAIDTALSGKQDTLIAGTNIKTLNNESLLGSGNIDIDSPISSCTQAQYDAAEQGGTLDPDMLYIITDATAIDIDNYMTSAQTVSAITEAVSGKADTSAVTAAIDAVNASLSGKQDTLQYYTEGEGQALIEVPSDISGANGVDVFNSGVNIYAYEDQVGETNIYVSPTGVTINDDPVVTESMLDDKQDTLLFYTEEDNTQEGSKDAKIETVFEDTENGILGTAYVESYAYDSPFAEIYASTEVRNTEESYLKTTDVYVDPEGGVELGYHTQDNNEDTYYDAQININADGISLMADNGEDGTHLNVTTDGVDIDGDAVVTESQLIDYATAQDLEDTEEVLAQSINVLSDSLSGKADVSAVTAVSDALSGKQDTLKYYEEYENENYSGAQITFSEDGDRVYIDAATGTYNYIDLFAEKTVNDAELGQDVVCKSEMYVDNEEAYLWWAKETFDDSTNKENGVWLNEEEFKLESKGSGETTALVITPTGVTINDDAVATVPMLEETEEVIAQSINVLSDSLSGKADASDVYTKTEIDNMIGDIETLLQAI